MQNRYNVDRPRVGVAGRPVRAGAAGIPAVGADPRPRRQPGRAGDRRAPRCDAPPGRRSRGCSLARRPCCRSRARVRSRTSRATWRPPAWSSVPGRWPRSPHAAGHHLSAVIRRARVLGRYRPTGRQCRDQHSSLGSRTLGAERFGWARATIERWRSWLTPGGLQVDPAALFVDEHPKRGSGRTARQHQRHAVTATLDLAVAGLEEAVRQQLVAELGQVVTALAADTRSQWRNRQLAWTPPGRTPRHGVANPPGSPDVPSQPAGGRRPAGRQASPR